MVGILECAGGSHVIVWLCELGARNWKEVMSIVYDLL